MPYLLESFPLSWDCYLFAINISIIRPKIKWHMVGGEQHWQLGKRNELNKNKHTHSERGLGAGKQTREKPNWIELLDMTTVPQPAARRRLPSSFLSAAARPRLFGLVMPLKRALGCRGNAPTATMPPCHTTPQTHTHPLVRLLWGFVCDFWVKFYSNLFALRWQKEVLCAAAAAVVVGAWHHYNLKPRLVVPSFRVQK